MNINRLRGLDAAESVVVDNLNDFGVFNALDSLPAFVVVDEDNLFAVGEHNLIRADQTDELAVFDDGIAAIAVFVHDALNIAEQIHGAEADGIFFHDTANGHALIDKASDGIGVIGREQNEYAALLSLLQN